MFPALLLWSIPLVKAIYSPVISKWYAGHLYLGFKNCHLKKTLSPQILYANVIWKSVLWCSSLPKSAPSLFVSGTAVFLSLKPWSDFWLLIPNPFTSPVSFSFPSQAFSVCSSGQLSRFMFFLQHFGYVVPLLLITLCHRYTHAHTFELKKTSFH